MPKPSPGGISQVPAAQLLAGASIRVTLSGTVTTAGAVPVVTLDDGSATTATLPGSLLVDVRSDATPTTQGSVIRASVNGGAIETLVLLPNGTAGLAWRSADGFHTAAELATVQALYLAPPPLIHVPGGQQ